VTRHHVAGLGNHDAGAEDGGEVIGDRKRLAVVTVAHAHDVELGGADAAALSPVDLVQVRAETGEENIVLGVLEHGALAVLFGAVDADAGIGLDVGEAEVGIVRLDLSLFAAEVCDLGERQ
ncbi:MAG: hypothetical protein SGI88_07960, partial [Candidatus Hydrogenedentes bacterium]|nr:hypothetical protein [Candidatus Hydrogenedentota bacterium]